MKSKPVYSYESRIRCLYCDVRSPGVPRKINEVKWLRNGDTISKGAGFMSMEMELLIEVCI